MQPTTRRNQLIALSLALAAAAGALLLAFDRQPGVAAESAPAPVAPRPAATAALELSSGARAPLAAAEAAPEVLEASLERFGPGAYLRYHLESRSLTDGLGDERTKAQSIELVLDSELELNVLAVRGDERALALNFRAPRFEQSLGGQASEGAAAAFAAVLASRVEVRVNRTGEVLGYRFAPEIDARSRNFVRALIATLQPRVVEPLTGEWRVEGEDANGRSIATYRLIEASERRVQLERIAREPVRPEGWTMPLPTITGGARFTFLRELGFVESLELDETSHIDAPDMGWKLDVRQTAKLRLVGARQGEAGEYDWEAPWSSAASDADRELQSAEAYEAQLRAALEGKSLADLLAMLRDILASGGATDPRMIEARELLAALLRLHPELLEEVAQLLLDGKLAPDLAGELIGCLGRCGTEQAQALLARWIADEATRDDLRSGSLFALVSTQTPGAAAIDAVSSAMTNSSGEFASAAALMLGVLSNRSGGALGERALDSLRDWEDEARDRGELLAWLAALGNSGSPQIVALVRPYLTDEDELVRDSAVDALRLVATLEAIELTAERSREDDSVRVRASAASGLVARFAPAARTAVALLLRSEPSSEIRRSLIENLGTQLSYDLVAAELLNHSAQHDPLAELRELAVQQLQGPSNS